MVGFMEVAIKPSNGANDATAARRHGACHDRPSLIDHVTPDGLEAGCAVVHMGRLQRVQRAKRGYEGSLLRLGGAAAGPMDKGQSKYVFCRPDAQSLKKSCDSKGNNRVRMRLYTSMLSSSLSRSRMTCKTTCQ